MIQLVDELYPTFRWFLFDGSRRYAAPVTVFGPNAPPSTSASCTSC